MDTHFVTKLTEYYLQYYDDILVSTVGDYYLVKATKGNNVEWQVLTEDK